MVTAMSNRAFIFLLSSFLSAVGDSVLVFAVPVGLGLETRDLRSAVLMWLIPAVAMFISSFFSTRMERRLHSARTDYGKLLLAIATLELAISGAALHFRTPFQTVALISGFVFLYALAKEGIPRLLYVVSVYRYFVEPKGYTQIAGVSTGLNIGAAFVGTCFAGWLVATGSWRVALVFDATTFVIFGLAVLFFGRDPGQSPAADSNLETKGLSLQTCGRLKGIQIFVPLLFGVNALIWNYLPLLSERLTLLNSSTSIFVIGFLRLPGMFSGLFIQRILKTLSAGKILIGLPALFLLGSLVFSAAPSVILFSILILFQGLISGLYWPVDFSVRNDLSGGNLIRFNTTVLRKLAITQFLGCLLALWVYSPSGPGFSAVSGVAIALIIASIIFHFTIERRNLFAIRVLSLGLAIVSLGGCSRPPHDEELRIVLPSVSQKLDLRPDLTYAGTAILNDTSAHLVHVSHDLTIQGDLLSRFESLSGGRRYLLDLKPEFRSARGDTVTADDVLFTIQYYLAKKRSISGALSSIEGAHDCESESCKLRGVQVESPYRLSITLKEPDLRWIEKLASPWLVVLKRNKPVIETIGTCVVPYQTGKGTVVGCDLGGVHLKVGGRQVVVSSTPSQGKGESTLLTESPTEEISPSLTVMAAFANPDSKRFTATQRGQILSSIRAAGQAIATGLHLKHATLLTPEWLGVDPTEDLVHLAAKSGVGCPAGSPIKILLDTSLPHLPVLREKLQAAIGCPIEFSVTNADTYFQEFSKSDVGIAWFTPDFLDLYDIFAPFDCSVSNSCSFNWHDFALQREIDKIKKSGYLGETDKTTAIEIERILLKNGYVAPIAEMNWWIRKADGAIGSIHPAGLFQVRVSDFL